jgi:hypothetical protein
MEQDFLRAGLPTSETNGTPVLLGANHIIVCSMNEKREVD